MLALAAENVGFHLRPDNDRVGLPRVLGLMRIANHPPAERSG